MNIFTLKCNHQWPERKTECIQEVYTVHTTIQVVLYAFLLAAHDIVSISLDAMDGKRGANWTLYIQ